MQIVVNQLLTRYELSGKGRLVLVLHGWGDSLDGLAEVRRSLAAHYRVLAVDLPGFGQTQPPFTAWDLDDYAGFVRDFLAKLEVGRLYAVIGHSNGGALAIRAVGEGVIKPEKLVLLAASGIRQPHSARRLLLKTIAKAGNAATFWLPERYRQVLRRSLYGAAGSDMLVAPHLQETFKRTVRQDVQADAAAITLPTLLLYAENDRAVPPADGRRYHQLIKHSSLRLLPGGHFIHLDNPADTLQAIREFLA